MRSLNTSVSLCTYGRIAILLLVPCFLFLSPPAEAGLPKAAVSIPTDQDLAAGLKAAEQCELQGKLIVLPSLPFQFAADGSSTNLFDGQAQAVQNMPEGSEVWLHVIVDAASLTGQESEKLITERTDAFLKSAPLSAPAVRGLITEVKEPLTAPDLLAFALLRLALTAKASNPNLRLAFVFVRLRRPAW